MAGLKAVVLREVFFQFQIFTRFWAHLVSAMGLLTRAQQQVQVKVKVEGR